jgi:hypothetical protein
VKTKIKRIGEPWHLGYSRHKEGQLFYTIYHPGARVTRWDYISEAGNTHPPYLRLLSGKPCSSALYMYVLPKCTTKKQREELAQQLMDLVAAGETKGD